MIDTNENTMGKDDVLDEKKLEENFAKNDENGKENNSDFSSENTPLISRHISYRRPRFYRRVFANLIDFLLLVCSLFLLFGAFRAIAGSTEHYSYVANQIETIRLDSRLYTYNDGLHRTVDTVTFYNHQTNLTMETKKTGLSLAIEDFLNYLDKVCDPSDAKEVRDHYDSYRLDPKLAYEGHSYFKKVGGKIVQNPDFKIKSAEYYTNVYAPYIDNYCQGFLISKVPNYYEYTNYMSNMLFYAELLPAFITSTLLVYFIPPLIFKRGRKTIGKLCYNIGLVDQECYNVKIGRTIARQSIVIFGELFLSIFTFCIPVIISFSMMSFSKKKQGFPDYMLGLQEIDTTDEKIYLNKEEIVYEIARREQGAVNFKLPDNN